MAAWWRLKYFSFSQRIFPNFGTLVFIILYFERLSFDDNLVGGGCWELLSNNKDVYESEY